MACCGILLIINFSCYSYAVLKLRLLIFSYVFILLCFNIKLLSGKYNDYIFIYFCIQNRFSMKFKILICLLLGISVSYGAFAITLNANATSNNGTGGIFLTLTTNTSAVTLTTINTMFGSVASTPVNIEIYTRTGPYAGFTTAATGWTLLGTVGAVSAGTAALAPINLTSLNITIPAGTVQSFYLHSITTGGGIRYFGTGTTSVTNFSDANLALFSDISRTGAVAFAGGQNTPRALTGSVEYNIGPLSLQWLNVSAKRQNGATFISWEADENAVSHFDVERKIGDGYKTVTTINSKGDGHNTYQAADATALDKTAAITMYRVKQTGKDGKISYSATVLVRETATNKVEAYPNPFTGNVQLTVTSAQSVTVTDITGKATSKLSLKEGTNAIDTHHWPPGTYIITTAEGETLRLLKQ